MVHVGGIGPTLGGALPKSPSFHQGLALATVLPQDSSKGYPVTFALHYQPLQPLLIGKAFCRLNQFYIQFLHSNFCSHVTTELIHALFFIPDDKNINETRNYIDK